MSEKNQERVNELQKKVDEAAAHLVQVNDAFAHVVMTSPKRFRTNEYKATRVAADEVKKAEAALRRFKKEAGIKDE